MICERCGEREAEYQIRWKVENPRDHNIDKFEANICGDCLSDNDVDFRKKGQSYEVYHLETMKKVD